MQLRITGVSGGMAACLSDYADYEYTVELEWVEDWAQFEKIKWVHKFDGKTILSSRRWASDRTNIDGP